MVGTLFLITALSSCSDDFLEVVPKGQLVAENTNDYDLLFNNTRLLNVTMNLFYKMSPEVCGLEPFYMSGPIVEQRGFAWEADIYEPDQDMAEIAEFVQKLYTYNKIINEVMLSEGGSEQQKLELLAEAKANRAWIYFMLVNFFGKPYDASTAGTDPAFPIIEEADVTRIEFSRASVQEVYDFIVKDLTEAIPHLPPIYHRLRFGVGPAEALLGKVYVFMGDYEQGLAYFNDAFTSFEISELPVNLYDYNTSTLPGGETAVGFFGPASPTAPNNKEAPFAKQAINRNALVGTEILLSPETSALYGPTDIRFTKFFRNAPFNAPPFTIPNVYRKVGTFATPLGVHLPDIYLLKAECKARLGDLQGAIADLEFFRKHRMPEEDAFVPEGLTQNQLLEFIIDERFREYAVQGYEWFTTRRLYNDPVLGGKTYTHTVFNADGTIRDTYTLTEERLVLRFNEKVMNANPGLENNP